MESLKHQKLKLLKKLCKVQISWLNLNDHFIIYVNFNKHGIVLQLNVNNKKIDLLQGKLLPSKNLQIAETAGLQLTHFLKCQRLKIDTTLGLGINT